MVDWVAPAISRGSVAQSLAALRRTRLGMGLVAALCGLGLAASGVTLVRAADDAGVLAFLRGSAFDRMIDPIRLRPHYSSEPSYVYRPRREAKRREARRREARRLRQAEIRRAGPGRRAARRQIDARQARPGFAELSRPAGAPRVRPEFVSLASSAGRRTVCVRTCDGFLFPLGTLHSRADLAIHRTACNAACPGSETRLYTLAPGQGLENPSTARSTKDGTAYGRLRTAFLFRTTKVDACECQTGARLATHLPILLDPTLRRGDVIVDANGEAKAFAGATRLPLAPHAFSDYEGSKALGRTAKAQVDKLMGTTLRRKIAAAYQRSQGRQVASLPAPPTRAAPPPARMRTARAGGFREVSAPAGSAAGVRAFSVIQRADATHPSGAQIITIQ